MLSVAGVEPICLRRGERYAIMVSSSSWRLQSIASGQTILNPHVHEQAARAGAESSCAAGPWQQCLIPPTQRPFWSLSKAFTHAVPQRHMENSELAGGSSRVRRLLLTRVSHGNPQLAIRLVVSAIQNKGEDDGGGSAYQELQKG